MAAFASFGAQADRSRRFAIRRKFDTNRTRAEVQARKPLPWLKPGAIPAGSRVVTLPPPRTVRRERPGRRRLRTGKISSGEIGSL